MSERANTTFSEDFARLRTAQKSNKGAPIYSVLINRPLGRVFAAAAHQIGLTPNQVTMVSAAFTLTGIALIALLPPGPLTALVVTVALVLGYALDAADGQLARLRGGGSLTGEWLDHVIDSFKIATLHLAVLISMYRFTDLEPVWYLVPLLFSAVYVVHFFGFLLTELLTRVAGLRLGRPQGRAASGSTLSALLKLPTDYGILALSFLLLAWPQIFAWVYLFLAVANAGYTMLVLPVWLRRLKALDSELAG
ncbi:hypothetical protein BW730_00725 [Tessaracoccus aquimaris]|uniref:CDP-alcohol phosphatidyltransferase n=1 Tax=Tessaracoccus aquimaris TaxID=1332264 RepID=A0A1Q2CJQ1_9ACTN|nr:CDP-alcohol phosphatidyltransferase family protein [Tessaracoccus aquimaris]AQP46313.1 hypothetical protein BW730_00725 [Tessaracoccus aquimaris]